MVQLVFFFFFFFLLLFLFWSLFTFYSKEPFSQTQFHVISTGRSFITLILRPMCFLRKKAFCFLFAISYKISNKARATHAIQLQSYWDVNLREMVTRSMETTLLKLNLLPFKKGSTLKEKNSLPRDQILFLKDIGVK